MTSPEGRRSRHGYGRVLLLGSCVLAVVGAGVLALGTEDARLLRLGIIAALWAALLGAFAAVRIQTEPGAQRVGELAVAREVREQLERREWEEITALRREVQSLRETLRDLLGGDVLVERVALRAESTRLRPLSGPAAYGGTAISRHRGRHAAD